MSMHGLRSGIIDNTNNQAASEKLGRSFVDLDGRKMVASLRGVYSLVINRWLY